MKVLNKTNLIKLLSILLLLMMFFVTSCRKNAKPSNSEETSNPLETSESTEETKEEDAEEVILENEGELEIVLSEDEETFGE